MGSVERQRGLERLELPASRPIVERARDARQISLVDTHEPAVRPAVRPAVQSLVGWSTRVLPFIRPRCAAIVDFKTHPPDGLAFNDVFV
jgi:hypothetical protein